MATQPLIESQPLSKTREQMERALALTADYESRVRPYVPEGYRNETSPKLLEYLRKIVAEKEERLARQAATNS